MTAEKNKGFLGFLISSLVNMANDQENEKFFFPNFLKGVKINGNESLVPYQTGMNLGQIQQLDKSASENACNEGWANLEGYSDGTATAPPSIDITSAVFRGLNNAKIAHYEVYDLDEANQVYPVQFTAALNAYDIANLNQLSIGTEAEPAQFKFALTCQTCEKPPLHTGDLDTTGTFYATFSEPSFSLLVLIAFNGAPDLNISITIPKQYTLPTTDTAIPGIQLFFGKGGDISIQDIKIATGDYQDIIENLANEFFGSQEASDNILAAFNQEILDNDVRSGIAAAIQAQFNSLIADLK